MLRNYLKRSVQMATAPVRAQYKVISQPAIALNNHLVRYAHKMSGGK